MNRSETRKISRDTWKKFGVGPSTLDPSGHNRASRRAGGIDINGNVVKGQRNQRPQRMAWVVRDGENKDAVLLAPLNRALKRVTAGRVRGE